MTNEHKCNKEVEIAEIHLMLKDIHKDFKGNGQPGMFKEWQQTKGAIKLGKWLLPSSVIFSIIATIIAIIK